MKRETVKAAEGPGRWAVIYKAGVARAVPEVWATVDQVPAEVKRADVLEALEAWHRWPALQSRIGIGGHVNVLPERQWPARVAAAVRADEAEAGRRLMFEWADLAPTVRRLTAPLSSTAYAKVQRAARQTGQSINAWAAGVLEAAAVAELEPAGTAPAASYAEVRAAREAVGE